MSSKAHLEKEEKRLSKEEHKIMYWRYYAEECKPCHYKPDCAKYFIVCAITGKEFSEIEKEVSISDIEY